MLYFQLTLALTAISLHVAALFRLILFVTFMLSDVFVRSFEIVDLCIESIDGVSSQTKIGIIMTYFRCADAHAILRRIYAYDNLHATSIVIALLKTEAANSVEQDESALKKINIAAADKYKVAFVTEVFRLYNRHCLLSNWLHLLLDARYRKSFFVWKLALRSYLLLNISLLII